MDQTESDKRRNVNSGRCSNINRYKTLVQELAYEYLYHDHNTTYE
jgi:hypothetical protein